MRRLLTLALCGLGLLALGSAAQAAPITGEVHFTGFWNPMGGTGNVATATGIDFSSSGFQIIMIGTGDFATLPGFGVAPFTNFTFAPFGGSVAPLWSFTSGVDTYSFDLEAVAVSLQTSTQLALTGSGTLHKTGFDDTPGDWNFSGGNSGGVLFSFQADNLAVPEPITVGLLGLGLIGLTAAGSKQARRIE